MRLRMPKNGSAGHSHWCARAMKMKSLTLRMLEKLLKAFTYRDISSYLDCAKLDISKDSS